MKMRKGYCRKHPSTRLPERLRASGRTTGCKACVRDYRARTRAQREARWKRGDLRCARHLNARAIRSSYLSSGTRQCKSLSSLPGGWHAEASGTSLLAMVASSYPDSVQHAPYRCRKNLWLAERRWQ